MLALQSTQYTVACCVHLSQVLGLLASPRTALLVVLWTPFTKPTTDEYPDAIAPVTPVVAFAGGRITTEL